MASGHHSMLLAGCTTFGWLGQGMLAQHGLAVAFHRSRASDPQLQADRGPAPAGGDYGDQAEVPMDYGALERERQLGLREIDEKPATPEEIASHLPAWAAELMLDPDKSDEYEVSQARARAKYLDDQRIESRTWEELETTGYEGEGAGMAEFTPSELAEDYQLPLETVCAALLSYGLDSKRLRVHKPVKDVCTASQMNELLHFLGSADPIACRKALCEHTLEELAEQPDVELSAEQLLALCRSNDIPAVLGVESRIPVEDVASLLDAADLEAAFLGPAADAGDEDDA